MRLLPFMLLVAGHLLAPGAAGQDAPATYTIGTWHEVDSKILGEKRPYIVSTPRGYESGSGRYVVIYLLDGDAHFHHTTGLVDFLVANELMPPALVVAIPNTKRTRDLTPPAKQPEPAGPEQGGADAFLRFIREELAPQVDKNHRTSPYRVLIGHSLGGLLAMHSLVTEPDSFSAYVAISPSVWWDNQAIVGQVEAFLDHAPTLAKSLYLTSGNEGGGHTGGILKLGGVMKEKQPKGFEWEMEIMDDESHNSVVYRSTLGGLRFVFKSWAMQEPWRIYEAGGMDAYKSFFKGSSEKFGVNRQMKAENVWMLVGSLAGKGKFVDALSVLEHDKETFQPPTFFYRFLGFDLLKIGETERAKHCLIEAFRAEPKDEVLRQALVSLGVDPATIIKPPSEECRAQQRSIR